MNNPSRCNLFHKENANINSIELEDIKESLFNMCQESSHNTELKLRTFKSDSLPMKITHLNMSFNIMDSSREWVMKYQKNSIILLANIHNFFVFCEELLDLSISTTEDKSMADFLIGSMQT